MVMLAEQYDFHRSLLGIADLVARSLGMAWGVAGPPVCPAFPLSVFGRAGDVERDHRHEDPCGVGRVLPAGQVCQGVVLQLCDDLLDAGVITVPLVGLDHAQGGVGDEPVVPVGSKQLALLGAIAGQVSRVGPVGLEPTTRGLKVRCSAN